MLESLLAEFATLTHTQRVGRLVAIGRAVATDSDAVALLDALAAGDVWLRRLAAWAGYGHRDADRLLALVGDPARGVRSAALRVAVAVLEDTDITRMLAHIHGRKLQTYVLAKLARHGRTGPIDAWLEPRLADTDANARAVIDLIPLGSHALVERHAARFAELAQFDSWGRLARRKPEAARDLLLVMTAGKPELDPRVRPIAAWILRTLATRDPDVAITLVPELLARGADPLMGAFTQALRVLARRRPAATFDAMREAQLARGPMPAPGAFERVGFDRRTEQLGVERITWLVAHAWQALPDQRAGRRWMQRLCAADQGAVARAWLDHGRGSWGAFMLTYVDVAADGRRAAFERWRHASQNKHGEIGPAALAWLPADLRQLEARRHLALATVRAEPTRSMAYAALLPYLGAIEALASLLGHPEGEVRALALRSILGSLRHDRDALAEGLALVHARRFEQDPVRMAMLAALDGLPDGVWAPRGQLAPGTLAGLEAALDDAWDAADLSPATASHAERLSVRMFRYDPEWATRMFARSLKVRGNLQSSGLLVGVAKTALERMIPALEQLGRAWLQRERWGSLAWLCRNLGDDLWRAPKLVAMVQDIAREAPFPGHTGVALELLARHHRPGFCAVAAGLIEADPSTVVFAPIARWTATRRQDLLERVLIEPMTGRWATGKTSWVIPFERGFATWTPAQQRRYATMLYAVIDDDKQSVPTILPLVRRLSDLSFTEFGRLLGYADDPRQPIRETAVRAVGRWDGPEASDALVGFLGDGRARWAIYALRRILLDQAPESALQTLLAAPRRKVTVAKEVIRLIGELGERGYTALLELGAEQLHRDVRIALLRALWSHLERDETWPVFEAAANDDDWVLASRLASVATNALSSRADARYCELLTKLLAHPEQDARVDLLASIAYAPVRDEQRSLFGGLLGRLGADAGQERMLALNAVLIRMRLAEAGAVAARILATRDRPSVLAGHVANIAVVGWRDERREQVRSTVRAALVGDPLLTTLVLQLSHRMDEAPLARLLTELDRHGWLGFDAMTSAIAAIGSVVYPDTLERSLRAESSPHLRRLGLAALVTCASQAGGWTPSRRAALEDYRRPRWPLVAGPARLLELPPLE